jgi:hypothetical protein
VLFKERDERKATKTFKNRLEIEETLMFHSFKKDLVNTELGG